MFPSSNKKLLAPLPSQDHLAHKLQENTGSRQAKHLKTYLEQSPTFSQTLDKQVSTPPYSNVEFRMQKRLIDLR